MIEITPTVPLDNTLNTCKKEKSLKGLRSIEGASVTPKDCRGKEVRVADQSRAQCTKTLINLNKI